MACPSKEQQKGLSGGGSSLVVPSTGQAGRVSGSRVQGPPSLAGAGAGPECLHSSHQLRDSTALGRKGEEGFPPEGPWEVALDHSCRPENEAKSTPDTGPTPEPQQPRLRCSAAHHPEQGWSPPARASPLHQPQLAPSGGGAHPGEYAIRRQACCKVLPVTQFDSVSQNGGGQLSLWMLHRPYGIHPVDES